MTVGPIFYTEMAESTYRPAARPPNDEIVEQLARFVRARRPLFVLTGAGCSTESGLPAYRNERGEWKHSPPMYYDEFRARLQARQRYWARSMVGWTRVAEARPNPAHDALARLERAGHLALLVTQNVDGLHQQAGSRGVVDLHGRIDRVRCLDCEALVSRSGLQQRLLVDNPGYPGDPTTCSRPDGDVNLDPTTLTDFRVPHCERCGGMLKPDVVFFGEAVARSDVEQAFSGLDRSRGVLVVGSSLTVFSGRRFCLTAKSTGKPVAVVNRGRTRVDDQATIKFDGPCGVSLSQLADILGA